MKRNIKLLTFFNFFSDFRLYSAILILYFLKVTGSFALSMSLFSITYISSAFFEIPTGVFSDMIGRKQTIVLGAATATLSVIFYAMGFGYWWLFVGAVLEGLSRAWYSGNNDALLHNTLSALGKKEHFANYLGKLSSLFQIALTFGAVIGGVIANFSYAWVMWLSVIPQIICFILSFQLIDPRISDRKSGNVFSHLHLSALHLWKNKNLRLLSLNSVIGFAIGESTFDFRSAFVKTLWPVWAIGFSKMFSFIGATLSFWYSGKILKKIDAFKLKFYASIYSRFINIVSVAYPTILSPVLLSSTSVFYGVSGVAETTLMQKEYNEEQRATIDSLNSLLRSLFYSVFAILIGYIADKAGPTKTLLLVYIISVPTIYISWLLMKRNKV